MLNNDWLFAEKVNRDARYERLKEAGHKLKRYTVRNQQLHPQYIEDLKDTPEGRDRGFGNTVYKNLPRCAVRRPHYRRVEERPVANDTGLSGVHQGLRRLGRNGSR